MAEYRKVYCKIWGREWFHQLDRDGKLMWLWLITNEKANVAGLYELSHIECEMATGISKNKQLGHLKNWGPDKLPECWKLRYEAGFVWVRKLRDYQASNSPTVKSCIQAVLKRVPDTLQLKADYIAYYAALAAANAAKNGQQYSSTTPDEPKNGLSGHTVSEVYAQAPDTVSIQYPYSIDEHRALNIEHANDKQHEGWIDKELTDELIDAAYRDKRPEKLCVLYQRLSDTGLGCKRITPADKRVEAQLRAREDWSEPAAMRALCECHFRARAAGTLPSSLNYYAKAVAAAMQRIEPSPAEKTQNRTVSANDEWRRLAARQAADVVRELKKQLHRDPKNPELIAKMANWETRLAEWSQNE